MTDLEIQAIFDDRRTAVSPLPNDELTAILLEAGQQSQLAKTRRRALVAAAAALVVVGSAFWVLPAENDLVDVATEETIPETIPTTAVGVSPAAAQIDVQIPDGFWVSELLLLISLQVADVSEADVREVLIGNAIVPPYRPNGSTNWDGLLLPGDYEFAAGVSTEEVVAEMASRLAAVTAELGYDSAQSRTGYSAYDALIVASLVEAEAVIDADRAKIARVIYNRLNLDLPLGIDSALFYEQQDRQLQLTALMLDESTPYNLRANTGLPPSPIGAPGRSSLEAAINPAEGDWIYYVLADADGSYFFTNSSDEFRAQREKSVAAGLFPRTDG